jgi:hypothetical protein
MPKYKVFLHGHNFLIDIDGEVGKHGFYTTRYVEAADPESAAELAVERLREDRHIDTIGMNDEDDPPRVEVDEVEEIESFAGVKNLRPGLAIYSEDAEDEDE